MVPRADTELVPLEVGVFVSRVDTEAVRELVIERVLVELAVPVRVVVDVFVEDVVDVPVRELVDDFVELVEAVLVKDIRAVLVAVIVSRIERDGRAERVAVRVDEDVIVGKAPAPISTRSKGY